MRRTSLAVLALVSSLALVGCGDDSGGVSLKSDRTTTTESGGDGGRDEGDDGGEGNAVDDADREAFIEDILSSDSPFDRDQAECIADEVLPEMSDEGRETMASDSDTDFADLSTADGDALAGGLDECVAVDDLVGLLVTGMVDEIGMPMSDDEIACSGEALGSGYSGAGDLFRTMSEADEEDVALDVFSAMGECISDETAIAFFSTTMSDTGASAETSDCIATTLVDQLGAQAFLEMFIDAGTGSPEDLESMTMDAALSCDPTGGFGEGEDIPVPSIGGGLGGQ